MAKRHKAVILLCLFFAGCVQPRKPIPQTTTASTIVPVVTYSTAITSLPPTITTTPLPLTSTPTIPITETPTMAPSPTATILLTEHLQLTFLNVIDQKNWIFAMQLDCPESDPPCFGQPQTLFLTKRNITFSWSPDGERVVMDTIGVGGDSDIVIFDSSGKVSQYVTQTKIKELFPTWLPDGRRIAFFRCRGEFLCEKELVSARPDGSDIQVISDVDINEISWLPDQTHFYFNGRLEPGPWEGIFLFDIVKSEATMIRSPEEGAGHYSPTVSPDGKKIAYIRFYDALQEHSDVFMLDLDSGLETNLTNGLTGFQQDVAWSPDGNWIAFSGCTDVLLCDLFLISPENPGNYYQLTFNQQVRQIGWRKYWGP